MDLSGWLTDTVTLASQSGAGRDGEPTYGSQVAIPARVQAGRDRKWPSIEHKDVLYTTTAVKVNDRLWLPGANTGVDGEARQAVHVESTSNPRVGDGVTLYKVLL
jgi:hypothetical protein